MYTNQLITQQISYDEFVETFDSKDCLAFIDKQFFPQLWQQNFGISRVAPVLFPMMYLLLVAAIVVGIMGKWLWAVILLIWAPVCLNVGKKLTVKAVWDELLGKNPKFSHASRGIVYMVMIRNGALWSPLWNGIKSEGWED